MTRPAFLFDLEGTLIDSVLARSASVSFPGRWSKERTCMRYGP
jgi:hypothetical protein